MTGSKQRFKIMKISLGNRRFLWCYVEYMAIFETMKVKVADALNRLPEEGGIIIDPADYLTADDISEEYNEASALSKDLTGDILWLFEVQLFQKLI